MIPKTLIEIQVAKYVKNFMNHLITDNIVPSVLRCVVITHIF